MPKDIIDFVDEDIKRAEADIKKNKVDVWSKL